MPVALQSSAPSFRCHRTHYHYTRSSVTASPRRQVSHALLRRRQAAAAAAADGASAALSASQRNPAALDQAWELLTTFTKKQAAGLAQPLLDSPGSRAALRDALLAAAAAPRPAVGWAGWAEGSPAEAAASSSSAAAAAAHSDGTAGRGVPEVLLGIVAGDVRLAVRSLRDYCQALGLPFLPPESRVSLQAGML